MKNAIVVFLCVCALTVLAQTGVGAQASPTPQATFTATLVPKGTPVVIKTTEAVSSYAANPGEPLPFEVVQDVVVDGVLIAKAGDDVEGRILESQQGRAGYYGIGYKAADLRIAAQTLHNYCGDAVQLHFIRSEYRRRQGLFGSKKDIEIIDGQKYIATTAYATKVCGEPTAATPAPIPDDALPGDKG